jgi:hypothetical protein
MTKLKFFTPALIVISGIFLILLSFSLVAPPEFEERFLNSDCMYLPSIYRDIFIQKNNMELWSFNAAPNVFPDLILYFLIISIVGNIAQAGIIYSIAQYVIIATLSDYILRKSSASHNLSGRVLLQILLLIPHTFTVYSYDFQLHFQYLSNAYHLGAMVNVLIAWSIILNILELKKNSTKNLAFIPFCLLLYTMSICDKLFWLLFLAPLFFYLILKYLNEKQKPTLVHISLLLLTFLMSNWTLNELRSGKPKIDSPFRNMSTEYIGESFSIFYEHMHVELTGLTMKSLFLSLVAVSIILLSFHSTRIFIRFFQKKSINASSLWFVFILASVILGMIAPIMNGSYSAFDCIRYNFPAMILALIALGLIIAPKVQNVSPLFLIIPFIILGSYWGYELYQHRDELSSKMCYIPEETKIIEQIATDHNLHAGVAPYWHAKKNDMFNQKGLKILPILDQRGMYIHANNKQWYLTENGSSKKQYFDFAIANTQEEVNELLTYFECECPIITEKPFFVILTPKFSFDPITELIVMEDKK